MRVLNDLHIGAERVSGTTLTSRKALRSGLIAQFGALLPSSPESLMILGDLFDKHDVEVYDVLQVYQLLLSWLNTHMSHLYLVPGNHDLSRVSDAFGSFDLLASLLESSQYGFMVHVIRKPAMTPYGYVIPHLPNQEAFDKAVAEVPQCKTLFLHCNYDNFFATQSDQSLNLSAEQAENCPVDNIVIAHEHNHKISGKVVIPGNQIASSVSDWLHCTTKYFANIDDGVVSLTPVAQQSDYLEELDWKAPDATGKPFVRIVGTASTEQAAEVVSAIAKFRASSEAFVVTNAVQITAESGTAAFSDSLESIMAFDVLKALSEYLDEGSMKKLEALND